MKKGILLGLTIAACAVCLTACGESAKDFNNTGIDYYNNSEYQKAVESFSKAVEMDKDNAEYCYNLGMAELELVDYGAAEAAFKAALGCDPDRLDCYRGLGMVHYFSGDYAQAIEDFGTLIANAKEDYNDTTLEALQYYASLQTYYGDYAGALDSYDILIRKNYNVAQQYFLRGSIYTQQGMENEAVMDYEEALKSYGQEYEIYYNIYYNFMQAGFTDRAESYLKRALEVNGADNLLKGKTYYILDDFDNAKKYLSKAVDEGKTEAEYYLAMTYEKLGNPEEAEEMYGEYIRNYPGDARAYNQYGMYFMNKGDYNTALQYFVSGLALNSEAGRQELLYNEACCYEYLHEYATAYSKFGDYLTEYPEDEAARHEYDFLSTR